MSRTKPVAAFFPIDRPQYASVATVRQRSSGLWQVKPPAAVEPRNFDSKEAAIKWVVSQGWGVHLLK